MNLHTNCCDIISILHNKGFVYDFELFGNNLLCIQERIFLRSGEFSILEYYQIAPPGYDDGNETVVFGIIAPHHHIKGILLNHYKKYTKGTPEILVEKLREFNTSIGMFYQNTH